MLYVSPPDVDSRKEILRIQLSKMSIDKDVDVVELAELTEGYSGAETVYICQEAGYEAMRENTMAEYISRRHFMNAIRQVSPRITDEMIRFYREFQKKVEK